ncbi:MAG TPA: amino acid adenylation domain-containing protein [Thermoanaerobaculia bacterium]|nr:amino acid adenylation domain-containing protein [Thermoanaerobaculia bacterium]
MGDRSKLVKSLSADELRRLTQRLKKGQGGTERIGRAPRDGGPLPLSFSQERLWFLNRFAPGNPAYNMPSFVRLAGRLDIAALRRTLAEVARRHESLRTTFGERDGVPFQVIAPAAEIPLPLADLSALPSPACDGEMLRLAAVEARWRFDLAHGPLFRTVLVRLAAGEHVLLLNLHHIVSDGWSQEVLIREVSALYEALAEGRPSPLPDLPLQYADYAVWQRNRLQGEALEKELTFWRERLAGTPPLELPSDRPRPLQPSFRGGYRELDVPEDAAGRLQALCRAEESTSYTALLAAFQALLLRYSGQTDFAVGSPAANRAHSELEGGIGFFVHTLALRAVLAGRPTFRELLRRAKETIVEAWSHEEVPFERIVEDLHPEREAGRNPIFQVILTLRSQSQQALSMGGLEVSPLDAGTGTAKVDLLLAWREDAGRLLGTLEYSSDLFDASSAGRMARHAVALLQGALEDPDRSLWELPLMDEAERRQTLADWNRTASTYPRDAAVHELFEEQAERNGGAVALEFEDRRLTYAELDARANQVAHRLRRVGVGPESLVVLSLPRSVEMIVGMLGILKAGGAYLPLDPGQPAERLAMLVEESRPAALVTLEAHLPALPDFGDRALCLDRDREDLEREPVDNPRSGATADNLVYVLYTSGSTGRPKAVAVPHRGLVRLIRGADYARLDAGETFFQFAPLSFDPSTLEIFGALANGGRLAVAPPGAYSLTELGRVIRRHGVTTLWLTSGLFHQMIEEGLDDLTGVRQLMSGGDVLSPPHLRRALAALPGVEIIDGYGPTENSCFTTCYRVDPEDPPATSVPIGRPVANTTVYILDGELRPVPVGVPGELCTGGDGLARGYMARPELTAERFIPSPLAGERDEPGARLYRTGDLARWRPDGNIDFLGRMDSQVKIRGYRIEPGEVEAVLAEHPALAECAVVVRREETGERRLVAWYIPSSPVTPAELKEHLGARLPAYMTPSAFVEIGAMPLTVSGKVDRRALARLEAPAGEGPSEIYAEPRTEIEKQVAAIWMDLLDRERIGRHDDFFDLGGHSLLATRVLSRLRESLRVDLPLTVLFEKSTLSALAAVVEEALDLPLSFLQEQLWFLEQLQPGTPAYNVPVAVRLSGALHRGAFAGALREIVRRHQILRITLGNSEGKPVQRVAASLEVSVPRVDLSELPEEIRERERERLAAWEAQRPFDLALGPVFRTMLVRLGPEDHVALITIHHLATDGWSMAVFIDELVTLYHAALAGRPSPLRELPHQYFDFVRWQHERLRGETLEKELAFWRERLAGTPPLEMPADRTRPHQPSYRGGRQALAVPEGVPGRLQALCRGEEVTSYMALLAVFQTLLLRYSGQTDFAVGSPAANRTAETEGLIGFFTNTLALRVDLSGGPTFRELLRRVKDAAVEAWAHAETPFERIVEALHPEREPGRNPVFQVLLAAQSQPRQEPSTGGLDVSLIESATGTALVDLTLVWKEEAGRLLGYLDYSSDLFDAASGGRMARHAVALLQGAVEDPGRTLWELPLLDEDERRQTLVDWNRTEIGYPRESAVHELFEEQVERNGGAVALSLGEQALTYAELNARANQVAHRLRRVGVGPESLVVLSLLR